ncbi:MAG: hypothetical protein LQ346_000682 [Caloplaca aetnensis]|nr:MAG: hypothetical protein LQ346_000682 [Caloplaca aetnensis]
MQKLLKRTAQVEKQAARRNRIRRKNNASDNKRIFLYQQKMAHLAHKENRNSARQATKEDWNLGPLAPRRDVGDKAETYGTVHFRMLQPINKPPGRWKSWGIREGDRVCVVGPKEREKGKIGVVGEVTEKAESCKVNVATPEYMKVEGRTEAPVQTTEAPLDLASVRLVTPLPDPVSGIKRDVIVNELTLTPTGQRYISNYISPETGKPHYIPWPPIEKPEFKDNDVDTLRIDVEQVTWTPTLLRAPFPSGVIDELRNKYSKFRTRHEDSYVEMKEAIDEREKWKVQKMKWSGGTPEEMLTPVQELNRQRRAERKGLDEDKLTDEVLAGIGEMMWRKGKRPPPKEMEVPAPTGSSVEAQAP